MRTSAGYEKESNPAIEWSRGEKVEHIEGVTIYNAFGVSLDGREWIGSWNEVGGCNDEICNIELA